MSATLRLKRSQFAVLMGITNAGMVWLVPLIPVPAVQGFVAATLNIVLIYLATEEKEAVNGGETSG